MVNALSTHSLHPIFWISKSGDISGIIIMATGSFSDSKRELYKLCFNTLGTTNVVYHKFSQTFD